MPAPNTAARAAFWGLLLGVWAAMALVLLGTDLFNLFVALELLTFAAVPLVCLDGSAAHVRGGAALPAVRACSARSLYPARLRAAATAATARWISLLLAGADAGRAGDVCVACALMTAGLLAKTALFPLHLWLPPAHAGAPPRPAPCCRRWW